MYLSELSFNPGTSGENIGFLDFKRPYSHHQWIWKCFEDESNIGLEQADFLFRLDVISNIPKVYLLSKRSPKQKILNWIVKTRDFSCEARPGDLFQFSLRANPVITRGSPEKRARHDVIMHAKKLAREQENANELEEIDKAAKAWLAKRASKLGVELLEETVEYSNYCQVKMRDENKLISLSTLDYRGVFRVVDGEQLSVSIQQGIGPAKAFGCGLMLIRRL